jgi:AraC family transcriptional regulator
MIRHSSLLATPELQISRYDHPAGHYHHDPKQEVALEYSVNRVEIGHFILQIEGRQWELRRGDLFLNYPGMVYRCRHAELEPTDVCMSIAFAPQDIVKEITAFERAARRLPVHAPTNRFAYLFFLAARSNHEPMAAEEAAREVIVEAAGEPRTVSKPYREHQLSWYAERVDAVRQLLYRHHTDEHNLAKLARSVGMSSFHFARIFRELVGMPPHAYLCRIRLRYAARSLREGASVTEACFASGFQNLSHFSRQFQRHFGLKPSTYTSQLR